MMGRTRMAVGGMGTLALAASVALLVGCTPQASGPSHSPAATSTARANASTGASPTPAPAPSFVADGTAEANKAYFDSINQTVITGNKSVTGRAIIDSLVAAGFDRASMQLTPDTTSINAHADSVLFSVRIGDSCLLGQHTGAEYVSSVQKALHSGVCLVGRTRPIDW